MTIQHVVFDIGRVLVHWDPEIPYRRLIPDEDERRRFLGEICNQAWIVEQDRGRTWAEGENAERFALDPARTLFIDDSPANVEGARTAGWQAVLFVTPKRLEEDLRRCGLLGA